MVLLWKILFFIIYYIFNLFYFYFNLIGSCVILFNLFRFIMFIQFYPDVVGNYAMRLLMKLTCMADVSEKSDHSVIGLHI